jgi:hypothetical protein
MKVTETDVWWLKPVFSVELNSASLLEAALQKSMGFLTILSSSIKVATMKLRRIMEEDG